MDVSVLASRTVTLHPVRRMDSEALDNGLGSTSKDVKVVCE
jgi:hypothetical protein